MFAATVSLSLRLLRSHHPHFILVGSSKSSAARQTESRDCAHLNNTNLSVHCRDKSLTVSFSAIKFIALLTVRRTFFILSRGVIKPN